MCITCSYWQMLTAAVSSVAQPHLICHLWCLLQSRFKPPDRNKLQCRNHSPRLKFRGAALLLVLLFCSGWRCALNSFPFVHSAAGFPRWFHFPFPPHPGESTSSGAKITGLSCWCSCPSPRPVLCVRTSLRPRFGSHESAVLDGNFRNFWLPPWV